jgi:DNA invertase Pin-like site-specific DNA recombinase
MKKAWILTRVSTGKVGQDVSPENQEAALSEYLTRNGWELAGVSRDRVSGQKGERDRPGLREALDQARSGKVQCIAVTRLDRLARNLGTLLAVSSELKRIGCSLVIQDLSGMSWVDTETPVGGFLIHLLGALAEFQARCYGDAAQAGKARAEARGVHCARPREVLPNEQGELVAELLKSGRGFNSISTILSSRGCFQPSRVISTTGDFRKARPWPPSTLRGAYERWLSERLIVPTKCPPQNEGEPMAENKGLGS